MEYSPLPATDYLLSDWCVSWLDSVQVRKGKSNFLSFTWKQCGFNLLVMHCISCWCTETLHDHGEQFQHVILHFIQVHTVDLGAHLPHPIPPLFIFLSFWLKRNIKLLCVIFWLHHWMSYLYTREGCEKIQFVMHIQGLDPFKRVCRSAGIKNRRKRFIPFDKAHIFPLWCGWLGLVVCFKTTSTMWK